MFMKALCALLGIESISYWRCFKSIITLSSFQAQTFYIFSFLSGWTSHLPSLSFLHIVHINVADLISSTQYSAWHREGFQYFYAE